MANIIDSLTPLPERNVASVPEKKREPPWSRIGLGVIVLLAIFMNFFHLGQNGYGNLYYASGVRSMLDSWHNFFFVSFDPGGFVTLDKPPLGFWLQTLSAKILGFTAFSILLPQALCGVLTVLLLYYLVRRHFGVVAGLVAALALAITPISVVTNRNNIIDGTLALALLLAAWALIHAAETGKLRWLLLSAVFVGLGFNIKMAEAYLVAPAIVLTYLFCAPRKRWTRIWHLLLAGIVVLVISLSWAAAVDLTPASQRPYVGSTPDNSELELALAYNGLSRLQIFKADTAEGNRGMAGSIETSRREAAGSNEQTSNQAGFSLISVFPQTEISDPLHLFSAFLGGQIAWLLPFALLGILALAWQGWPDFQRDRQQLGLVLWGFWLLTMVFFFTFDTTFHQYYMTEMAPGLCALVGIGLVTMWRDYRSGSWRGWLLPIALAITGVGQIYILTSYPTWSRWLNPLISLITALVVIALILFRLRPRRNPSETGLRLASGVVIPGLLVLLLAPTLWAGYSVIQNTESSYPTAGPNPQNATGFFALFGGNGLSEATREVRQDNAENATEASNDGSTQANQTLIAYLEAHQGTTTFLVATLNSSTADAIILATNKPVMAMGGFSGNDPIVTASDLPNLIRKNTVRYFLINAMHTTGERNNPSTSSGGGFWQIALSSWISAHCSAVPTNYWTSFPTSGAGDNQLYDCAASA